MSYYIIRNPINDLAPIKINFDLMVRIIDDFKRNFNIDEFYRINSNSYGPCVFYSDTVEIIKDNGLESVIHVYFTVEKKQLTNSRGCFIRHNDYGLVLKMLREYNSFKVPSFGLKFRKNKKKKINQSIIISIPESCIEDMVYYNDSRSIIDIICHEFTHAYDSRAEFTNTIGKNEKINFDNYINSRQEIVATINGLIGILYYYKADLIYHKVNEKINITVEDCGFGNCNDYYHYWYNSLLEKNRLQARKIIQNWIDENINNYINENVA